MPCPVSPRLAVPELARFSDYHPGQLVASEPVTVSVTQLLYSELAAYHDSLFSTERIARETAFIIRELGGRATGRSRVLELGCGTGRYLRELAANGFVPCGIDISATMLSIARARLPHAILMKNDFTNPGVLQSAGVFSLVAAVSSVLMYVPDSARLRMLAQLVYDALEPGGLFVFDLWKWIPAREGGTVTRGKAIGCTTELTRLMRWFPVGNTLILRERFVIDDLEGSRVASDEHRLTLFDTDEVAGILSDCGFTVDLRNGFSTAPFTFGGQKAVLVCRRGFP